MDSIICVVSSGRFDKYNILLVGSSSDCEGCDDDEDDGGGGGGAWPFVSEGKTIKIDIKPWSKI